MSFKLPETINFFTELPNSFKKIKYTESFAPKNSNWLKKISCFGWHSRTQVIPYSDDFCFLKRRWFLSTIRVEGF
jgi:hypothetical protein